MIKLVSKLKKKLKKENVKSQVEVIAIVNKTVYSQVKNKYGHVSRHVFIDKF